MYIIEDQLSPNCMPCTNAWEFLDQFLKAEQQNYLFVSFHIPKISNKTWSEPINIYIKTTGDHIKSKNKKWTCWKWIITSIPEEHSKIIFSKY
jgi:hypothetical protein